MIHAYARTLRAVTARAVLTGALLAAPYALAAQQTSRPRTLSLEEALSLAGDRSEILRIAEAGVQRARGQQAQARGAFMPQLTGSVNYQRQLQSQFEAISNRFAPDSGDGGGEEGGGGDSELADNPLARIFASPNTITLGLQLTQPIYAGGRLRAGSRAAAAAGEAALIGETSARAQVQLAVTQSYFDAVLAGRLAAIAESSLVQTERTLRITRLARRVGTTSEFDLLRSQVARDNQRPRVLQARTQRDVALLRLKQLLEFPLDEPLVLTTPLDDDTRLPNPSRMAGGHPDAPVVVIQVNAPVDVETVLAGDARVASWVDSVSGATNTSAGDRAPVRQAVQNAEALEEQLRIVRGQRLPALSLSSGYQRFAYPSGGVPTTWQDYFPNWTVSVGLSFPIFTGGRIRGQELVAEANLAEARAQLQQVRELAELDARLALAELEQAASTFAASAGTAGQAGRAYSIAEVRFREGISTQVELADAQLLLQQAEANQAQAARDLSVARVRLALLQDLPLPESIGAPPGGAAASRQPNAAQPQTDLQLQPPGSASAGGAMTGTGQPRGILP